MTAKIKPKQICTMIIALFPITKLIGAPAFFAKYCNEKLWQPLILLLFFDLLLLFLIFYIQKKHQGKTFFNILCELYNPTFAKILFFIYAVFFLAKAVIPILEQKQLIENAFYETLPQAPVFYPAFIVIFYVAFKGLKSFFRVCDFCMPISIIGLLLILFLSIPATDLKNLLPVFTFTNKSGAICALKALSWFGDAIYLLFFIGSFSEEKTGKKAIFITYIATFLTVVAFFITFYGVFSYIAPTRSLALSSMSIFGVTLVNVGRFDYIALFMLAVCGIVAVSLPIVLSTNCIKLSLNLKNSFIPALVTTVICFIITLLFSSKYNGVLNAVSKYLTPFFIVCGYLLPLFAIGGKNVQSKKS